MQEYVPRTGSGQTAATVIRVECDGLGRHDSVNAQNADD